MNQNETKQLTPFFALGLENFKLESTDQVMGGNTRRERRQK